MSPLPPDRAPGSHQQDAVPATGVTRCEVDPRRTTESAVLALISLVGVWWLRFRMESILWWSTEVISVVAITLLAALLGRRYHRIMIGGLLASPMVVAIVARRFGSPVPFEMTALSTLGVGSLALAIYSQSRRHLGMSVVTSGFLILFTASISDEATTLIPSLAWITFCLWHLVANHWERVTACTPDQVRRSTRIRPATVVFGVVLFVLGGWAIRGRMAEPNRFSWGIMPTSGGSSWSDPAARSGVGSGDAAIAAKDHAESFGAVESDLFLESTESTLFDMFSDSLGPPKLKVKWERRQGMTPEKLIHAHQRTAKSERGGASFSTSRTKPQPPPPLRDAHERAVIQWIGPTGIRLAMNRYDTFDGVDWSQQASWKNTKLSRVAVDDEAWFFDSRQVRRVNRNPEELSHSGVLKVLRLDSTRIPSPMMTAGVHIKDVDRPDFFGIDHDGSFFMPGRVKIPNLTVLHLASTSVMEDELLMPTAFSSLQSYLRMLRSRGNAGRVQQGTKPPEYVESKGTLAAGELARKLTAEETNPYRKLQSIISHLRDHYTFDRQSVADSADPLDDFLTSRRGGDHLFATAAAAMGRAAGFNTRLVSGFYVRPGAIDVGQGHVSVVPEDVHVWVEVQLDDGRWIELEPTPGYRQPVYQPSAWLLAKRFAGQYWPHACIAAAMGTVVYVTRVFWFEILVWLTWLISHLFSDRHRVRVLLWILQQRARFAGKPRKAGMPQRDWLLTMARSDEKLAASARACCDAADRMVFGGQTVVDDWSAPANLLVRRMTTQYISRGRFTEMSQMGVRA